jgi:hypothetical protein
MILTESKAADSDLDIIFGIAMIIWAVALAITFAIILIVAKIIILCVKRVAPVLEPVGRRPRRR